MIVNKLDPHTRKQWFDKISFNELPSLDMLKNFIDERAKKQAVLNKLQSGDNPKIPGSKTYTGKTRNFLSNEIICKFCAAAHYINQCKKFLALTPQRRFEEVRSRNLCVNCLKANHNSKACGSSTCRTCRKKHHTLLHFPQSNNINSRQNKEPSSSGVTSTNFNITNNVLLSTAVIQVKDNEGRYNQYRALLDNGSQSHFMTEELSKTLKVRTYKTNMSVSGLNNSTTSLKTYATICIRSRYNSFETKVNCLIVPKITGDMPALTFDRSLVQIPSNINLADPDFNESSKIDILIGADLFWQLIKVGQIHLGKHCPVFQNTVLGWLISGEIPNTQVQRFSTNCNLISNHELDQKLTRLWELDVINKSPILSDDEKLAEDAFSIRCLHEIAHIHENEFSTASQVILKDFYVDDLLTGGDTLEYLIKLYHDIDFILKDGGFALNKWVSNHPALINHITTDKPESIINIGTDEETHSLGLLWLSKQDHLSFQINFELTDRPSTKRSVLSTIARIFDPLGILGPIVIKAKIILQNIWKLHLGWDESLPLSLHTEWQNMYNSLAHINDIRVNRNVLCDNPKRIELHGFADSSEKAFGACIYIRSVDESGRIYVNLFCAKSRVAPVKPVTIPRLELCAALLLAQLYDKVISSWKGNIDAVHLWSDSTVTLGWLRGSPHQWKVFVANRVSEIQTLTKIEFWHYVNTHDNPADIVSRGINPESIVNCRLWWQGPIWLSETDDFWPMPSTELNLDACQLEARKSPTAIACFHSVDEIKIFERYSSLYKLYRVVAFMLRFKFNCTTKQKLTGSLNVEELNNARNLLIKSAQLQSFPNEIVNLKTKKPIKKGKLLKLNPYLDSHDILRVGGRLKYSDLPFEQKHPIILDSKHPLSQLLVATEHIRLLHAGPQLLLANIREKYWILGGRNLVRRVTHSCVTCFRVKPNDSRYIMGDLPKERVTPCRPFLNAGIDFCGPFSIKDKKTRKYNVTKGYVCLFVCMATKALHLELATELTSEAFLACLHRFFARRGKSLHLYTDNGSNFIAANKELRNFLKHNSNKFNDSLGRDDITWHFMPPRAPHFGGLWESGVKTIKYHLKRVIGLTTLTYEEFYTILTQVEACVNSRPLFPMSSEPEDPLPLTPGHFLIGEPLTSVPTPDFTQQRDHLLTRFKLTQKLMQTIWCRWSKEYINELQVRSKWRQNYPNLLKQGAIVLLKEDNLPPLKWSLGRILELHPGKDGVTRVVSVKTSGGVLKRPVMKVCVLPDSA
nr:unnamed protein product [Callosobruchus chinensis]